MKPILLLLLIVLLGGCNSNRNAAIQSICNGVKSTGKACSSAVGLAGKCAECGQIKENIEIEIARQIDLSTLELKENRMLW